MPEKPALRPPATKNAPGAAARRPVLRWPYVALPPTRPALRTAPRSSPKPDELCTSWPRPGTGAVRDPIVPFAIARPRLNSRFFRVATHSSGNAGARRSLVGKPTAGRHPAERERNRAAGCAPPAPPAATGWIRTELRTPLSDDECGLKRRASLGLS